MIKPIKHDIKPIIQPDGSNICGPTALYVVAKYLGLNLPDYQDFLGSFTYIEEGTYLPQLGAKALDIGLNAEIVMFNPYLFSINDIGQNNITPALDKAKTRWADNPQKLNGLEWFDKFKHVGGITHVQIPTIQHIANALAEEKLVIALGTTCFLMGYPKYNFHFSIISGIDEKFVYIVDSANYNANESLQPINGIYKHTHADFIYSIHATTYGDIDNGGILIISK